MVGESDTFLIIILFLGGRVSLHGVGGSDTVSVGRCALFCFWEEQAAE